MWFEPCFEALGPTHQFPLPKPQTRESPSVIRYTPLLIAIAWLEIDRNTPDRRLTESRSFGALVAGGADATCPGDDGATPLSLAEQLSNAMTWSASSVANRLASGSARRSVRGGGSRRCGRRA